jgi:4-amino-4-deoxy-L-arabinose transferase-like glycosyltransferase
MKRLRSLVPLRSAVPALCAAVLWAIGPGDEATGRIFHMAPRLALTAIIVLMVAGGLGERLLAWLRVRPGGRAEYTAYAVAAGMGALSFMVMALALCHLLSRHTIMVLLIGIALLAPPRAVVEAVRTALLDAVRHRYHSIGMAVLVGVLIAMVLSFVALAACPPTDSDSLRYHLRLPELYLQAHTFQYPARNHFAHFPLAAEMLYAVGLTCAGGAGANVVGLIAGLTCLLAIYGIAAPRFSPAAGLTAAAIFATTPLVGCLFGTAVVDLFVCLYVVLGVGAILNYGREGQSRWLVVAGLSGGMATAVKLGGGYSAALMAAWAALSGTGGGKGALRRFLTVAAPAALVVAPWIIKTTIVTGNPLFPLFPDILGGRDWRPEYTAKYVREVHSYGRMGGSPVDYLLSPVWMTMYWQQYGSPVPLSPIYLVMLLSLPLMGERGRPAWPIVAWCGGFLVMWLLTAQVARFVLPGLAVLSLAAGLVAVRVCRSSVGHPLFVPIHVPLMLLAMAGWTWTMQWKHLQPWPYLSGRMTQAQYMAEHADYYPVVLHANRRLPADSRILFVGETLSYNLHRPALVETGFAGVSAVGWANQARSARELADDVQHRGFTHVLLDKKAPDELWARKLDYFAWRDGEAQNRFRNMLAQFSTPLYAHRGVCLYELHPSSDGRHH